MTKVYFKDKCIMETDFSQLNEYLDEGQMDNIAEGFSRFMDRVISELSDSLDKTVIEEKRKEIWKDYEHLYELGEEKEREANEKLDNIFEAHSYFEKAMNDELSEKDAEKYWELYRKEVEFVNELDDLDRLEKFITYEDENGKRGHSAYLFFT